MLEAAAQRRSNDTGFVRSFAYVSGPLYAFALDATSSDWRERVTVGTDLGALLGEITKSKPLSLAAAKQRADARGGKVIGPAEDKRARERAAQIVEWRRTLVDGPVLAIDMHMVTAGGFDPRAVYPISETETVFKGRTLIGTWGTLEVDGGAILIDHAKARASVSLAGASADSVRGTGWSLSPAAGWAVGPGAREGDRALVRR